MVNDEASCMLIVVAAWDDIYNYGRSGSQVQALERKLNACTNDLDRASVNFTNVMKMLLGSDKNTSTLACELPISTHHLSHGVHPQTNHVFRNIDSLFEPHLVNIDIVRYISY